MAKRESEGAAERADALARRLAAAPNDAQAYRALHDHYRGVGDYASLANLVAGFASYTSDEREASRAYQEVAELFEQHLGDTKRAEGFYRKALKRLPTNIDASEGLQALLERGGRLRELTDLIAGQLDTLESRHGDPRDIAVLCYRLGELWGKHFDRGDEALGYYRKAYELDPSLLRAIYEARLLQLQRGDRRAAAALYEKEVAAESSLPRKAHLLRELASLYEELDDIDGSVSALERAKALAPQDLELTHLLATGLLRRSKGQDERMRMADLDRVAELLCDITAVLPQEEGRPFLLTALTHAPWHARALSELETLTQGGDATHALAAHWVAYLAHNPEGEAADRRRIALAKAYLDGGQVEDARFCLTQAAQHGVTEAKRMLAALAATPSTEQAAEHPDLVTQLGQVDVIDALREQTRDESAPWPDEPTSPGQPPEGALTEAEKPLTETVQPARRAADPATQHAGSRSEQDSVRPAPNGQRASAARADDTEVIATEARPGAGELEARYGEDLPALQRELSARVASGQSEAAVAIAERILELDPLAGEAFALLDRHYRQKRDFRRRAELMLKSADHDELPLATRRQRLREAVSLFETRVADVDAALLAYRRLAELEPEGDDARRGRKRLLERARRWDELAEVLDTEVALQTETEAKLLLLRRLTELHRRERGDHASAAQCLEAIVALAPGDRPARAALTEELIGLGRNPEAADWLERRIRETDNKSERLPLLRQLGKLLEERMGDADAAFLVYERILEISKDDAHALDRMAEIDEASGSHERLLATLERRAQRAAPAAAADVRVRMATLAEADLLDRTRAASFLREALTLAPANQQILTALCNLYERDERYDELLTLLRERASSERNEKARADLYRRIGRVLAQHGNDDVAAEEAYATVLTLCEDREALLFIEQRARAAQDAGKLQGCLGRLAALESEPEARKLRLFEQSTLLVALGKQAEAAAALSRILLEVDAFDAGAKAELEKLCEALGDYRPLATVLELSRTQTSTPEQLSECASELADLYEAKLQDEAKTIRCLVEWAQAVKEEPRPLRRLAAIYQRKRRYKDLLGTLDALSSVETSQSARVLALRSAAELAQSKLNDDAGAFRRVAELVTQNEGPLDPALLGIARKANRIADLCDLCEVTGRHQELFALLRERIAAEPNVEAKVKLQLRLAAAFVEHTQDEASALAVYEELLTLGDDTEALRFVQSWSLRHDDPERLSRALERLARIETSPSDRRDLLLERGHVLQTRLNRPREAITVLEEALALDGRFEPTLLALVAACEAAPDHGKLAAVLERLLGRETDAESKLSVLRQLADLYEGPLTDERRALHALERWTAFDATQCEPLRRLRAHHEKAGHLRELLTPLDSLAEHESEPKQRIEASIAAARLAQNKLSDTDGAFARLSPLVPLCNPAVDAALLALAGSAGQLGRFYDLLEGAGRLPELASHLEQSARVESDAKIRALLLRRAAKLAQGPLEDEARAAELWTKLLALEEDAEALRFMQARALRADDSEQLCDALLRLSALERDPREQRDLLYEHAHLLNARLARASDAIPVLVRVVFELDADFEPAIDELISAAEAAGDSATLARALERLLERATEPAARAELAARLSALYQDVLHDEARAHKALTAWQKADPSDITPVRALRVLLSQREHGPQLIATLDEIVRLTEDDAERVQAQLGAARLCFEVEHDVDATLTRLLPLMQAGQSEADALYRSVALGAGRVEALAELYEGLGRYDELVELLQDCAEAAADKTQKAELLLRCAHVLANSVGDEVAAAEAYRDVLTLREDAEALGYLRGVAEHLDDIETLEGLLQRLSVLREDRSEKRDLLLARALLLNDRLDRTNEAIEVLRHIVTSIDPSCVPAIDELIAASEAVSNLPALAQGLERKLVLSHDADERRRVAQRLADLYEGELVHADRAAEALRRLCEVDSHNLEAHRRLRPHLLRQHSYAELVRVLDRLVTLEPTKAARQEALLTAAKLAHEALGDAKAAFHRLSPLVVAGDLEAEHLADSICKAAGLGRELAGLYISRAQHAPNREEARASWRQVVRIHEEWLHEPGEAFEASLRLLATAPDDREYLDEVDRLGTRTEAFGRLAQVYGKLIKDAGGDTERVALLLRLTDIFEVQARDPGAALDCLLQACQLARHDDLVLARAEDLARRLGNNLELLWIHEARAARAQSDEGRALAWLEAARTADIGLGDREQANLCLRRALALTETTPALSTKIEELAAELDRARPALGSDDARRTLVRAHVELSEAAEEPFRSRLLLHAAQMLRAQLGDDGASFDVLRQGSSSPPFSEAVLDELEQTAIRIERLDALNAHLARSADRASDLTEKLRLVLRRARVLHDCMGRDDQAAQAYQRVLDLDPDNAEAASALFTCLRKAGRYRELLHAFERRLERTDHPEQQLDLLRDMAALWEVELKNRASAIEVWSTVKSLAPEDQQAQHALERLQHA